MGPRTVAKGTKSLPETHEAPWDSEHEALTHQGAQVPWRVARVGPHSLKLMAVNRRNLAQNS